VHLLTPKWEVRNWYRWLDLFNRLTKLKNQARYESPVFNMPIADSSLGETPKENYL
jgi:hypothetical protein